MHGLSPTSARAVLLVSIRCALQRTVGHLPRRPGPSHTIRLALRPMQGDVADMSLEEHPVEAEEHPSSTVAALNVGPRARHPTRFAAPADRPGSATHDAEVGVLAAPSDPMVLATAAIRWGVLIFGLSVTSASADSPTVAYGLATSALIFNAAWRTLRPVVPQGLALGDVLRSVGPDLVVAVLAAALTGGWGGPYALAAVPAVLLAGHLGGLRAAATVLALDAGALLALSALGSDTGSAGAPTVAAVLCVVGTIGAASGRQRRTTDAQQDNDLWLLHRLLTSMHGLTRATNVSLDLDDVLAATRDRIKATFDVTTLVIVSHGIGGAGWRVVLADGEHGHDVDHTDVLRVVGLAMPSEGVVLGGERSPLVGASGICQLLRAGDEVVGALILDHDQPGRYDRGDLDALATLAGPVALTIDNARWFRRIRTSAADEERVRIARELHDGVAQSLVAAHLDLGRVGSPSDEVERARVQVDGALQALRQSLADLRAGVTAATPLSTLAREAVAQLEARSRLTCRLEVVDSGPDLPPRIEHEVWRILQEALANVERHASASLVQVRWHLDGELASLDVVDDGVGFDPNDTWHARFGLRGMFERADAVGASLQVRSEPGAGTVVAFRLVR